jgi:hypothetical protein
MVRTSLTLMESLFPVIPKVTSGGDPEQSATIRSVFSSRGGDGPVVEAVSVMS